MLRRDDIAMMDFILSNDLLMLFLSHGGISFTEDMIEVDRSSGEYIAPFPVGELRRASSGKESRLSKLEVNGVFSDELDPPSHASNSGTRLLFAGCSLAQLRLCSLTVSGRSVWLNKFGLVMGIEDLDVGLQSTVEIFLSESIIWFRGFKKDFREVRMDLEDASHLPLQYSVPVYHEFFTSCITVAQQESMGSPVISPATSASSTSTAVGDVDITKTKDIPEDILPQLPLISDSYPRAFSDYYVPKGPQVQPVLREARPVCNHPIRAVWHTLGEQVYKFLHSLGVLWSTIDPVCFAEEEGEAGPLYLWVGINSRSPTLEVAKAVAVGCKKILAAAQFPDIEIAFRDSVFTHPFTGTLGVQVAPQKTPYFEGTGALYLCESGQSNRVFLLTARHVPLPMSVYRNELYEHKTTSQHYDEVLILGSRAYQDAIKDMMAKIGCELIFVDQYKRELAALGKVTESEDATRAEACQEFKGKLMKVEKTITAVDAFHGDITKHWNWALIELNCDKIDWNHFKGNIVYLGNKILVPDFILKMHPHPKGRSSFKYPVGSLLSGTADSTDVTYVTPYFWIEEQIKKASYLYPTKE
ncbi:hypothetical protein BKA93DRAFT_827469 [Sparassis latifolia]